MNKLPNNSVLINQPISFYQQHRALLIPGAVTIGILLFIITILLISIGRIRKARNEAKTSEEKFRGLFISIRDGIAIVDENRIVVDCNPAFSGLFGYSLQDIRGKNARILYQSEEQFVDFGNTLKEFSGDGRLITKTNYKKKNGELFIGEIAITYRTDIDGKVINYIGLIRDITDRIKMEEKLVESQEQFEIAMDAAEDGLYDWNLVTNTIYYSPGYKRMLGYEDHELVNDFSIWENLTKPEDVKRSWAMQQELLEKKRDRFEIEFKMKHKDGHWVDILSRAKASFDKDGKAERIIGTHVDISERKQLQASLLQAQKMESIGSLAGGIAHDFNNILASILGFSELALDEVEKGSTMDDNLQEIYAGGLRAKEIVKQILAFARQSDEEIKPTRVDTIIIEALKLIRPSTPTTIEIRQEITSSSLVIGNATQIHQIMMNLCTNAAHAMQEDGGIMEVSLKDTFFREEDGNIPRGIKKGKYIELIVSDTGCGIEPEHFDSIFDPYFTTKDTGEGTGMGLAMVRGIIDTYGGTITVESSPSSKTVFTIYLPITSNLDKNVASGIEEPLVGGDESILFVDDEPSIARMGGRILENLGYTVTTRTSSIEALKLFKAKPDRFSLVITDMTMPHMTGDKFAHELKQVRANIPIILCTGYSNKINEEIAQEIGINAFTYKPLSKTDLASTVREVLDKG